MIRDLRRLLKFVAKYKGRLVWGVSLFFIARLFGASVPLFLMVGIDRLAAGNGNIWLPLAGIVGAVACRFVTVTWARIAIRRAGYLVQYDMRDLLYRHLQRMGPVFFANFSIGDLMTRAIADIQLVRRLIANGTTMIVIFVFATLVGFGCMIYLSPMLTLFVLPPLPFLLLFTWRTSLRLGVASRAMQERLGDIGGHVAENLTGIRTIQAMVQEENELARFHTKNQAYADAFFKHSRIHSFMHAVMPTLASVSLVAILGYGGSLVMSGELSVGAFTAFFFYVNMIVQPFRVAGIIISIMQRAAVASRRLHAVYDYVPEIADLPSAQAPEVIRGKIEIRSLTFTYPDADAPTIDNLNLTIERGETISIMGRVGCGKTTFLKQLVRLLDTPQDSIFLDGTDICDYSLSQLRSQVALVPQDSFLFGETLRQNITYDEPRRRNDLIWQAAEAADLSDTIEEMNNRMETVVGERGITLSGGQKQRTTLARGFIRHAPVLVLDDCFASVDTETEEHILGELHRLRANQTTLLVSHRVSTARHSDRIVIMDDGTITEMGTHEELIALGGFYAELERIQREGADERDYLDTFEAGVS